MKTNRFFRETQKPEITTRAFTIFTRQVDKKNRSITEAIAATESPVIIYDREYGLVPEVLRMDGCQLPKDGQTPLLNSHRSFGVENVLGSARNYRISGENLLIDAFFASDPLGESTMTKVEEGHLRDLSVGYQVFEYQFVPAGQRAVINGKTYQGPMKVSTQWAPFETSVTPIGADENAKMREAADKTTKSSANRAEKSSGGKRIMFTKYLIKLLISRGMAAGSTQEAMQLFWDNLSAEDQTSLRAQAQTDEQTERAAEERSRKELEELGAKRERDRQKNIRELCRAIPGCEELESKLIEEGVSVADCHARITAFLVAAKPPVGGQIAMGKTDVEKFRAAVSDGLILRMGGIVANPVAGATDVQHMSLLRLSEELLRKQGISVGFNPSDIAARALTSSDLPYLLANAVNKSLQTYATEDPQSWRTWCKIGRVNDFKQGTRIKFSGVPNLKEIREDGDYEYTSFSEEREVIQAKTYGRKTAVTRQMIMNDDLQGLMEIPMMLRNAGFNKIADLVYAYIINNTALSDTVALFHSTHKNLGSAATMSTATLSELKKLLRVQTDKAGNALNTLGRFLLVPAALEDSALVIVRSTANPDANKNANTFNPNQGLTPVVEARLDASSITAHYLIASQNVIPTVEVAFLNGVESPVIDVMEGRSPDATDMFVRFDIATCLRDHRGIAKNAGA